MKYITNYIKTKGKYKTNWYKPGGERRNGTKWQIFKWGVFLHVAMALIAEKGLNPPIIGLLNQNSQKRNSTQGSFIFLNVSTFCITFILFYFILATNHGAQKLSKTTTWPYKWTASSRKG